MSALSSTAVGPGQTVLIETSAVPGGVMPFTGAAGTVRRMLLTDALADTGIGLTATATGGACGISRTAGTSLTIVGEATSSNAKTDKAVWAINVPSTYVAGAGMPVAINCLAAGTGTLTGVSTTMTLAAYLVLNGVESALTVSAAQPILTSASTLTFTVSGASLVAGAQVMLEFVMLITTASGANTGTINAVQYTA